MIIIIIMIPNIFCLYSLRRNLLDRRRSCQGRRTCFHLPVVFTCGIVVITLQRRRLIVLTQTLHFQLIHPTSRVTTSPELSTKLSVEDIELLKECVIDLSCYSGVTCVKGAVSPPLPTFLSFPIIPFPFPNLRRGSVVRTSLRSWRTFPDLRLIHG